MKRLADITEVEAVVLLEKPKGRPRGKEFIKSSGKSSGRGSEVRLAPLPSLQLCASNMSRLASSQRAVPGTDAARTLRVQVNPHGSFAKGAKPSLSSVKARPAFFRPGFSVKTNIIHVLRTSA